MKCISIKPPWGWLIVHGYKPVENRTWRTSHRGPILIHQSKRVDKEGDEWIQRNFDKPLPPDAYQGGGIIGKANLVACVTSHVSPWFFGPYGFVFKDPQPLPFTIYRGRLSIFDVPWPLDSKQQNGQPDQLALF